MRWLDPAWWNYFRQEYPDRFALCCGIAAAVVGLGGYASVSAFGGSGATAGDYGVNGPHSTVTQLSSMPLALGAGAGATTLSGWLAQGLDGAPAQGPGGSPSTGGVYAAGPSGSQPVPQQQSGGTGSPSQPGAGDPGGPGVVTTVVTPVGTTEVIVTTSAGTTSTTTTTVAETTTTQGGVTLPTPVTTVTVPITVPKLP